MENKILNGKIDIEIDGQIYFINDNLTNRIDNSASI